VTTETGLSEREAEILRLIATGATNQRIANELKISVNTVKVHVRNIFSKAGVASRAEAVMYAVRVGLVPADVLAPSPSEQGSAVSSQDGLVGEAGPGAANAADQEAPAASGPFSSGATGLSAEGDLESRLSFASPASIARRRWLPPLLGWYVLFAMIVVVGAYAALAATRLVDGVAVSTPSAGEGQGDEPGRWRVLAPLPFGLSGFAMAGHLRDGKQLLYVIGGTTGSRVTDQVLRYDPATNVWVPMSPKPTPVTDVRAAVIGNRIYVPGGRLGSGAISVRLEAYDTLRDTWLSLAPLPAPRSGYALAAFEGKLYLLGGWDGSKYRREVWQYNPDDDTWRARAPMPSARAFAAAVSTEAGIYVVGGESEAGSQATHFLYSPAADDQSLSPWSTKAPIPSPVGRGDAAGIGGMVMVVGAEGTPGQLQIYSSQTDSWRSSQIPLGNLRDLRVQATDNKLYLVGGVADGRQSAAAYEYRAVLTVFLPVIR